MTMTVSIGRNVEGVPMGEHAWQDFRALLVSVLEHHECFHKTPYFAGVGHGWYEGAMEESFTVVCEGLPVYAMWMDFIADLGKLREEFGQDSIAVTTGTTRFV